MCSSDLKFVPTTGVLGQPGFDPFILTATDPAGKDVTTFDAPVTIQVGYTEAQLRARGLVEGNLTLAYFNEQTLRWEPVPTRIDRENHRAIAEVSHFTSWMLSGNTNPSALYVPSLQGFQVSDFTGAASFSIPMELPAGAAGHRPSMSLSYSSAATDGAGGQRHKAQAGWVGKGWNLGIGGSVARIRSSVGSGWDAFTFSLGGKSLE